MTLRIGITGPIGCGKSTVAGWLAERGAVVVDADRLAREVTAPGEPALAAVLERFGDVVRGPDGNLDRAGARADRLRRPGRTARPGGDRPSGGPAADRGRGPRSGGSTALPPS